jgi:hypothetical protein
MAWHGHILVSACFVQYLLPYWFQVRKVPGVSVIPIPQFRATTILLVPTERNNNVYEAGVSSDGKTLKPILIQPVPCIS